MPCCCHPPGAAVQSQAPVSVDILRHVLQFQHFCLFLLLNLRVARADEDTVRAPTPLVGGDLATFRYVKTPTRAYPQVGICVLMKRETSLM